MAKGIKIFVDKVLIRGPRIDGTYIISLEVSGDYQRKKLSYIMLLDGPVEIEINEAVN